MLNPNNWNNLWNVKDFCQYIYNKMNMHNHLGVSAASVVAKYLSYNSYFYKYVKYELKICGKKENGKCLKDLLICLELSISELEWNYNFYEKNLF